jgi:hypothetical protein
VLPNNQVAGPTCLAAHITDLQACSVSLESAAASTSQQLEQIAAADAGARYVDTNPLFCSQVCTPVVGRINVYVHNGHVSATYARFVAGALEAELQAILDGR